MRMVVINHHQRLFEHQNHSVKLRLVYSLTTAGGVALVTYQASQR